jgi:hypothetical protein
MKTPCTHSGVCRGADRGGGRHGLLGPARGGAASDDGGDTIRGRGANPGHGLAVRRPLDLLPRPIPPASVR